MKARLPRKYKKEVNKLVAKAAAKRNIMTALVSASSAFQVAVISSQFRPIEIDRNTFIAERALKVAEVTLNTAQSINKIMSEKPHSWKDFLR